MKTDKQSGDGYQILTQTRQQKGWCTAVMAEKLLLTETAIQHIEQGNSSYFPKGPYFTGNLKRYCECLGIDSDPLLAAYYAEKTADVVGDYQEPHMHKVKLSTAYQHKKHKIFYGLACAVMVCVLVAAMTSQTIMATMSVTDKPIIKTKKLDESVSLYKKSSTYRPDLTD